MHYRDMVVLYHKAIEFFKFFLVGNALQDKCF